MIVPEIITQVVDSQYENIATKERGQLREVLSELPDLSAFALIVSGVRRCGKSTLLFQLLQDRYPQALYINFEDPRLYGFEMTDFTRLDQIIRDRKAQVLMFDELQIVPGWERYVRQKLDESFQLVITGSNAELLSRELGTKLTGRQITKELYPFSFLEYLMYTGQDPTPDTVTKYLMTGGFPEYIKQGHDEILHHLLDDILIRDIAVRYGIREVAKLRKLALYLISNVAKPVTANRLKSLIEVGSTNTVTEYLAYLEDTYLFHLVPKYDHSLRKQLVNPRKVYAIDTGLIRVNSVSSSGDHGRMLENLVFLQLKRMQREIFYFSEKGECDFVAIKRGQPPMAIQVCYQLDADNLAREVAGLVEALEFFDLSEGLIITHAQRDHIYQNGKTITVLPAHEFLNPKTDTGNLSVDQRFL